MSDEWTVVDTKTQKAQKSKERRESKLKERAAVKAERDREDGERLKKIDEMYIPVGDHVDETPYSNFYNLDYEKEQAKKKTIDYYGELPEVENKKSGSDIKHEQKLAKQKAKQREAERQREYEKQKALKDSQRKNFNLAKLDAVLSTMEARYPDNVDVQLKVLADHFEVEYGEMVAKNYNKLEEFPARAVDQTSTWLDAQPRQSVSEWVAFLLDSLVGSAYKPRSTKGKGQGVMMLLQLAATNNQYVLLDNADKITDLWEQDSDLVDQLVVSSRSAAFTLWLSAFLPAIMGAKAGNKKFVDAADQFFNKHVAAKSDEPAVWGGSADDELMRSSLSRLFVAKAKGTLPEHLHKLYKRIADPAFLVAKTQQKAGHGLFKTLLSFVQKLDGPVQEEVLALLLQCLKDSPKCCRFWQDVYPDYIQASEMLMKHILSNLKDPRLPLADLVVACDAFLAINKEYLDAGSNSKQLKANVLSADATAGNLKKQLRKLDIKPRTSGVAARRASIIDQAPPPSRLWVLYVFLIPVVLAAAIYALRAVHAPDVCGDNDACIRLVHIAKQNIDLIQSKIHSFVPQQK